MAKRKYPYNSVKINVMSDHGGRCACCNLAKVKLYTNAKGETEISEFDIGEFAHIHSEASNGPRYDSNVPVSFLQSKENFLLLCKKHHKLIDDNEQNYSAEQLKKQRMKFTNLINSKLTRKNQLNSIIFLISDSYFNVINTHTIHNTIENDENIYTKVEFRTSSENTVNIDWELGFSTIIKEWLEFKKEFLTDLSKPIDRYHIYGITHIPYAFLLGLLIKDTSQIYAHQWDRDEGKWCGEREQIQEEKFVIKESIKDHTKSCIMKIELTTLIDDELIKPLKLNTENFISISVENPSKIWLKSNEQTQSFAKQMQIILEKIFKLLPKQEIHLFYSGPIPIILLLGTMLNPRLNLPINIYNYKFDSKLMKGQYKLVFNTHNILNKYNLL